MNKTQKNKLLRRISLGDVSAAFLLGKYYVSSYDYRQFSEARRLLMIASRKGIVEASFYLGLAYEEETNPARSWSKSIFWYTKAAKANHAEACNRLAVFYEGGIYIKKDLRKAIYWYTRSAELGSGNGQENLGVNYEQGIGVKRNFTKTMQWYEASMLLGYTSARYKYQLLKKKISKKRSSV